MQHQQFTLLLAHQALQTPSVMFASYPEGQHSQSTFQLAVGSPIPDTWFQTLQGRSRGSILCHVVSDTAGRSRRRIPDGGPVQGPVSDTWPLAL